MEPSEPSHDKCHPPPLIHCRTDPPTWRRLPLASFFQTGPERPPSQWLRFSTRPLSPARSHHWLRFSQTKPERPVQPMASFFQPQPDVQRPSRYWLRFSKPNRSDLPADGFVFLPAPSPPAPQVASFSTQPPWHEFSEKCTNLHNPPLHGFVFSPRPRRPIRPATHCPSTHVYQKRAPSLHPR